MANKVAKLKRKQRIKKIKACSKKLAIVVRNVAISAIIISVVFTGTVFGIHKFKTNVEKAFLQSAGLYKQVTIDNNRTINVASYGNTESKHTIVPISDIGVQDLSVFMQHMAATVKDEIRVALIDRAGYGFSQDSFEEQTINQIISDYRIALQKSGIKGPYVLLAHQFGGVYATYWATNYPDEIEGVIYLDGTPILESTKINNQEPTVKDWIGTTFCKIGFHRMAYHDYYAYAAKALTKQEAKCSKALNTHGLQTIAQISERALMGDNFNEVLKSFKQTDIPKLYVSSQNAFGTEKDVIKYYEYENTQRKELGLDPFYVFTDDTKRVSDDAQKFIAESKEKYKTVTKPFVEALGNCQLTRMPGDEKIYEHKPEGLVDIIKDFINYLDGDEHAIKDFYDDNKVINWENFQEEHKAEDEIPKPKQLYHE